MLLCVVRLLTNPRSLRAKVVLFPHVSKLNFTLLCTLNRPLFYPSQNMLHNIKIGVAFFEKSSYLAARNER